MRKALKRALGREKFEKDLEASRQSGLKAQRDAEKAREVGRARAARALAAKKTQNEKTEVSA